MSEYNINSSDQDDNYDYNPEDIELEACIDKLLNEEDKKIGFDFSLLKRNELNVNLIHFDKNMSNNENYKYYNYFKVNVVGGFQAVDDINFLIGYLEVIKDKKIPYIVISSGSSANEVIPICQKYSFVKEIIIFCGNYQKYKHYIKDYKNYVKKVFTSFKDVCDYIQSFPLDTYREGIKNFIKSDSFLFTYEDIQMDKQFEQCPVISAFEYDNYYFLIHRVYAHFFEDMNSKNNVIFTQSQFNRLKIL